MAGEWDRGMRDRNDSRVESVTHWKGTTCVPNGSVLRPDFHRVGRSGGWKPVE